jgi:cytochrome c peroxidase
MIDVKRPLQWMALGASVAAAGCSSLGGDDKDGFTADEWKSISAMTPLKGDMYVNLTNSRRDDEGVAKLGQRLFFDTSYAEALTADNQNGKKGEVGKVGCVSCHDPAAYFVDNHPDPSGVGRVALSAARGPLLSRQAPMMLNEGWYEWAGWTARFDSLVTHGSGVMGVSATRLYLAHWIHDHNLVEYNTLFPNNAMDDSMNDMKRFPPTGNPKAAPTAAMPMPADGPWEAMSADDQTFVNQFMFNMGRVWETYPRFVKSPHSKFENYANGDYSALTAQEKNGLRLFVGKAACNECHTGPILSDSKPHNIGVANPPGTTPDKFDLGRYTDMVNQTTQNNVFNGASKFSDDPAAGMAKLAQLPTKDKAMNDETLKAQFRTPSILNCEKTYPYFHTGLVKTLEDVVDQYDKGGAPQGTYAGVLDPKIKPLMLTDQEKADLVAFLKTLTGQLDGWSQPL